MIKFFYSIILVLAISNGFYGQNLNYIQTCIANNCFNCRIADDPIKRSKGLMGETSLPKNEGMLFIFPSENKPEFWMKNTKIPLDIIFINDNDIIVYMVKNAPPCINDPCPLYKTTRNASKVLEINAGLSKKHNFKTGQVVTYYIEDD